MKIPRQINLKRVATIIIISVLTTIMGSYAFLPCVKCKSERGIVVFTFDDESVTVYTEGYPILKQYGFPATFYINPFDVVNGSSDTYVNWSQLRELEKSGWEIGLHYPHWHLSQSNLTQVKIEVEKGIDKILSEGLKYPKTYAYPYGDYNASVQSLLSHYVIAAFTTQKESDLLIDIKDVLINRYALPRMPIDYETGGDELNTAKLLIQKAAEYRLTVVFYMHDFDFEGDTENLIEICQTVKSYVNNGKLAVMTAYKMVRKRLSEAYSQNTFETKIKSYGDEFFYTIAKNAYLSYSGLTVANLLINPGFEWGALGLWKTSTLDVGQSVSVTDELSHSGGYSAKLESNSVSNPLRIYQDYYLYDNSEMYWGNITHISVWVKANTTTTVLVGYSWYSNGTWKGDTYITETVETQWKKISLTYFIPFNTTLLQVFIRLPPVTSATTLYVDDAIMVINHKSSVFFDTASLENLLNNCGFETGELSPWYFSEIPSQTSFEVVNTESHSGSYSLKIYSNNPSESLNVRQAISYAQKDFSQVYFSCWIKSSINGTPIRIGVMAFDSSGKWLGDRWIEINLTTDWNKYEFSRAIPIEWNQNATFIMPFIHLNPVTNETTIWIDDAICYLPSNPITTSTVTKVILNGQSLSATTKITRIGGFNVSTVATQHNITQLVWKINFDKATPMFSYGKNINLLNYTLIPYQSEDFDYIMNFTIQAPKNTSTITEIYCGNLNPRRVIGASSWKYDIATKTLTITVLHEDEIRKITIYFESFPEAWLPMMFIFGMVGLGAMIVGPLYAINKIKKREYLEALKTGTVVTVIGIALFIAWLWPA